MHDAISSFNLRVTVTTKSSPLHTILVLFPHESLPLPLPIPEEEELPIEPLLNIFARKLEPKPVPAPKLFPGPKPVPRPTLLPTPDFTILVGGATVGSFSFGSYIARALSKSVTYLSLASSLIKFCVRNRLTVSLIILSALSTSAAPPY